MKMESLYRWEAHSRAKDETMVHTDTPATPWYVVESDIRKQARLNMMAHLLSTIEYHDVERPEVKLPKSERELPPPATATLIGES